MPATIVSGLTNITLANNNTGFGVWKRDGTGGTPTAVSETDVFIQGTGACSVKVSNQGVVLAYATGGLNLSAAGTHLYIWCNMLAGGLMATRASNGLCIFVSSDATLTTGANYKMWAVDGSDTYPGGWVRYVIDLSKTATVTTGTLNLSSVQHVGMYCDARPNVAKFDNLVIDRIDYTTGTGLRVYGTSTTDDTFGDILTADQGTIGNKYGIVTSKGGIIYCRGRIELGDDVGTNASNLTDVDKTVVWENPVYYNGSSVVSCVSSTFYRLDFKGNGTGNTSIQLGKKVGIDDTARGRNGITFQSAAPAVTMDFDDGQVNTAKVYGSTFRNITGGLSWGTNTAHEFIGSTVDQSAQFDPVGGIIIRNCVFSGHTGTNASLLWNSNINIVNCSFIANADATNNPAGIQHSATGTVTYNGLSFSGNDVDVYLSATSGTLTINSTNGTNAATSRTDGTSSVSIINAVNIVLTNLVAGSRIYIYNNTDSTVIFNQVEATTTFSQSVNYAGDKSLTIRVRNASSSPSYKAFETTGTLTSAGFSLVVNQVVDQ